MAEPGVPEKPKINRGRLLVTLLVGGVLAAICFILNWWWVGSAFLLLTVFAACFSFSPDLYPIAFTVFVVFAIAWLTGAWLDVALHRYGASAWWRDALPILGGFAIGVVVPAFFWFVTFAVSTKWVLGLPETLEIKWWDAFTFVSTRAFGLAIPYVQVENGQMKPLSTRGMLEDFANPELVSLFGGPGTLVVGEGNAVVLERGGKLSRVLGEGTYKLKRGEWFKRPVGTKGIHDLRGSAGPMAKFKNKLTKDGVPVEIWVGGTCHLERKAETDSRPASRSPGGVANSRVIGENSKYPIYEATILKAVYKTDDDGWKTMYPFLSIAAMENVVATYTLDEVMGLPAGDKESDSSKTVRGQILEKVTKAIGQRPLSSGVVLGGLWIVDIIPPPEIREAMAARRAEPFLSERKLREADTKRRETIAESEGKAASIIAVETARHNASDAWVGLFERLKELLPRAQDPEVARRFAALVQDLLLRVGEDDLEELMRRLRRLQGDQPLGMPMYGGVPGPFVGPVPGQSPQRPILSDGTESAPDTQREEPKN